MDYRKKSKEEIDKGAVLVISGEHKGRIGFYCLQNEQTYDMRHIKSCPVCKVTVENVDHPVELERGAYCPEHRKRLIEGDMAVIYWDKPYGDDYSLVHPSELVQISNTEYARHDKESKMDVEKYLLKLLQALEKI